MGDRKSIIDQAIKLIHSRIGKVRMQSSYYETEPWGVKGQDDFLNIAIQCETDLSPRHILAEIIVIEKTLGRERTETYAPRTIDIDILLVGNLTMNDSDLVIPHPKLKERNFVLIPLMEIAGEVIEPISGLSIEELYESCTDPCEVWIYQSNN